MQVKLYERETGKRLCIKCQGGLRGMFNNANTPGMILEQLGHDHPSLKGPTKLQTELCLG